MSLNQQIEQTLSNGLRIKIYHCFTPEYFLEKAGRTSFLAVGPTKPVSFWACSDPAKVTEPVLATRRIYWKTTASSIAGDKQEVQKLLFDRAENYYSL